MFKWLLENSLANRLLVLIAGAVLMGYPTNMTTLLTTEPIQM